MEQSYVGRFIVFENDSTQTESCSGSIVSDAQLQGGLGVLLGWLVAYYAEWPGVLPLIYSFDFASDFSRTQLSPASFAKMALLWLFNSAAYYVLILRSDDSPPIDYGATLAALFLPFYAVFVMRPLISNSDSRALRLGDRFDALLRVWLPTRLALMLLSGATPNLRYLRNHFEETWLVYFLVTIVLLVALWRKRKPRFHKSLASVAAAATPLNC
jgi:hypothetical protein